MDEQDLSFAATIAYGWLALAAMVLASLWLGGGVATVYALLACAAAYVAQAIYTLASAGRPLQVAAGLQVASCLLWLAALFTLGGS